MLVNNLLNGGASKAALKGMRTYAAEANRRDAEGALNCWDDPFAMLDKFLFHAQQIEEGSGDRNASVCGFRLIKALVCDKVLCREFEVMRTTCEAREREGAAKKKRGGGGKMKKGGFGGYVGYVGGFENTTAFRRITDNFVEIIQRAQMQMRGNIHSDSDSDSGDEDEEKEEEEEEEEGGEDGEGDGENDGLYLRKKGDRPTPHFRAYASSVAQGAKPSLRACSNCGKLEGAKGDHKTCSGCKSVAYCGSACQKEHWSAHKADCKRLKKGKSG